MEFKQYPSYKNSGVEWLGEVPEHWEIVRTKDIFNHRKEEALADDEIVTAFRDGQVTLRKNRRTDGFTNSIKEHGYQHINSGDLVIHEMDAFAGAIGVSDSSGKSTPVYTVCYSKDQNVNHHFYSHFFRTMAKTGFINSLAKGIRVRSTEFRWNESRNVNLALPPKLDQQKIVSFLDTETARIDNLISKQQKLIELLEEQRKSIISHAVTKGLNPNAPMKDSGVEWLGEVPDGWNIKRFSHIFIENKKKNTGLKETNVLSLSYGSIKEKNIDDNKGLLPESFETYQIIEPNDIVFRFTDLQNDKRSLRSAMSKFHGIITSAYIGVKTKENADFYNYLFRAYDLRKVFYSMGDGMRQSLKMDELNKMPIVVPKPSDQQKIVSFLDTETARIDNLISKQKMLIEKLKEYRSSIISHAVTGKIDVREWVA